MVIEVQKDPVLRTDGHFSASHPHQQADLRTAGPSFAGPSPSFAGLTGESPADSTLMRSKYCVRYELGLCPKYQGAKPPQELFLVNNGRRLALHFDCAACEMTVTA